MRRRSRWGKIIEEMVALANLTLKGGSDCLCACVHAPLCARIYRSLDLFATPGPLRVAFRGSWDMHSLLPSRHLIICAVRNSYRHL